MLTLRPPAAPLMERPRPSPRQLEIGLLLGHQQGPPRGRHKQQRPHTAGGDTQSSSSFPSSLGDCTSKSTFNRSFRFSETLLRHGRFENHTLDEATNRMKREARLKERHRQKIAKMTVQFHKEAAEVLRIQVALRDRQRHLAVLTLRSCCAVLIQAEWRGYLARRATHKLREHKAARTIALFWRSYLKTKRNAIIITRSMRRMLALRRRAKLMAAVVAIQAVWRGGVCRNMLYREWLTMSASELVYDILLDDSVVDFVYECASQIQRVFRDYLARIKKTRPSARKKTKRRKHKRDAFVTQDERYGRSHSNMSSMTGGTNNPFNPFKSTAPTHRYDASGNEIVTSRFFGAPAAPIAPIAPITAKPAVAATAPSVVRNDNGGGGGLDSSAHSTTNTNANVNWNAPSCSGDDGGGGALLTTAHSSTESMDSSIAARDPGATSPAFPRVAPPSGNSFGAYAPPSLGGVPPMYANGGVPPAMSTLLSPALQSSYHLPGLGIGGAPGGGPSGTPGGAPPMGGLGPTFGYPGSNPFMPVQQQQQQPPNAQLNQPSPLFGQQSFQPQPPPGGSRPPALQDEISRGQKVFDFQQQQQQQQQQQAPPQQFWQPAAQQAASPYKPPPSSLMIQQQQLLQPPPFSPPQQQPPGVVAPPPQMQQFWQPPHQQLTPSPIWQQPQLQHQPPAGGAISSPPPSSSAAPVALTMLGGGGVMRGVPPLFQPPCNSAFWTPGRPS